MHFPWPWSAEIRKGVMWKEVREEILRRIEEEERERGVGPSLPGAEKAQMTVAATDVPRYEGEWVAEAGSAIVTVGEAADRGFEVRVGGGGALGGCVVGGDMAKVSLSTANIPRGGDKHEGFRQFEGIHRR